MSQTITQLKRGGLTAIDITSDGNTDAIVLSDAFSTFSLSFAFTGADADPIIILQGSNDNTEWFNMLSDITDLNTGAVTPIKPLMTKAFSNTANGVSSISGDNIPFKYFRLGIEANGSTTGSMGVDINTETE